MRMASVLALAGLTAGCASGARAASVVPSSASTWTVPARIQAAVYGPSHDDRYVCSNEAASSLAFLLDGRDVKVLNPSWSHGGYTCEYAYVEAATVTVSVRDFATWSDASRYFDQRHRHLSDIDTTAVCNDYCYVTRDGIALLRNGPEVLFVDASRLPSATDGMSRAQNALSVLGAVTPP
jgi:hypothetical protein